MSRLDTGVDYFFPSLTVYKHLSVVDKLGLEDTTINISKLNSQHIINFSLKEFLIFNNDGQLILQTNFIHNDTWNGGQLNKFIKKLFKADKKLDSKTRDNFVFFKLYFKNRKILLMSNHNLIFVAIFGLNTNSYFGRLYLLHIFTAFLNFIGNSVDNLKDHNDSTPLNTKELLHVRLFESYYILPLTRHFEKNVRYLLRDEEMFLTSVKFKNFLLIDISTGQILFDMNCVKGKKKSKKIQRNEKLWQELMHHSMNLMMQYQAENQYKHDNSQAFYNFVKIECTSTFPRLTFIIKFLPILNGVSMIQIYSQNKLSRYNENETSITTSKHYRELDIIYGSEIKNSSNIEFRYTEPKKLKEIEKYLNEYFLSILNKFGLFYNSYHEAKYFDISSILTIDEIINQNRNLTTDQILAKIDAKFLEMYQLEEKRNQNMNPQTLTTGKEDANSEFENPDNFLVISKTLFLREFFRFYQTKRKRSTDTSYMKNEKDNTLILTKIEDQHILANEEPEMSFELAKQLSEICYLEYNEDGQTDLNKGIENVSVSMDAFDKKEIHLDTEKFKMDKGSPILSTIGGKEHYERVEKNEKHQRHTQTSLNKLQRSISYLELQKQNNNTIITPMRRSMTKIVSPIRNKSQIEKFQSQKNLGLDPIQLDISEINNKIVFPQQVEYQAQDKYFKNEGVTNDQQLIKEIIVEKLSNAEGQINVGGNLNDNFQMRDTEKIKILGNDNTTFR